MKILNIGILAHVDAGKTTLTESLLYVSGAIAEPGSVEAGTTRTDTMPLEQRRGITIQAAVASFHWNGCKINVVDTPGHMDFLAEVYRSLAVLDGAVLVISAKDGVQAQARTLFYALQKMKIPTVIFINKIDQEGVDLQAVYRDIADKLSPDSIVTQDVSLAPDLAVADSVDLEKWDAVIAGNDCLLEKYLAGTPLELAELKREGWKRTRDGTLFPICHGSAKSGLGVRELLETLESALESCVDSRSAELCASVFKVGYSDRKQRLAYLRLYSGALHIRDMVELPGKKKRKLTEMRIPLDGKIVEAEAACPGEIVILPDETLKLNDVLGDRRRLSRRAWTEDPTPMLRTSIEPKRPEQREALLHALTQIADIDPLLHYRVDAVTHEIVLSFLGKVQLEVVCALLEEKYGIGVAAREPTVIYLERPVKRSDFTAHIEVPPNPFWASIGLSIEPLPIGSGVQLESRVSLGYLNQSFQNAVWEGAQYGLEQGVYGWEVTDCKICFEYGRYYSPVSTPADFRLLAPVVLEQALWKAGTQLLEPYLSFTLYAPQEYLARAYHDASKYDASIETARLKKDEAILTGQIPARCIPEYRSALTFCTNGRGVCIAEQKGYLPADGETVIQPRRPNTRLDKVRHLFRKAI